VFKELPGILECQLVQERIGEIEARVVAGEGWSRAGEDELTRELHERLGYGMMVRVRRVGSIPRTANGKFRAVIGIDRGAGGLRSKTRPEP
jgi:phenylacetate-CoA ligase